MTPKVVLALTPPPRDTSSAKICRATPPNSEVINAPLLHFKPIFDPPLKKVVRKAPVLGEGCASKTWSFSSACTNLGMQHPLWAEICFSEKCAWGMSTWAPITLFVLDGISQNFFLQRRFQRYLRSNSKVVVKRTKFWTFFVLPNFKGAVPPNFVLALTPQPRGASSAKVSSSYTP